MVRFEKKKIIIEIEDPFPEDCWLRIMRSILSLMAIANKELVNREDDIIYDACDFLIDMLLDDDDMVKLMKAKGLKP